MLKTYSDKQKLRERVASQTWMLRYDMKVCQVEGKMISDGILDLREEKMNKRYCKLQTYGKYQRLFNLVFSFLLRAIDFFYSKIDHESHHL